MGCQGNRPLLSSSGLLSLLSLSGLLRSLNFLDLLGLQLLDLIPASSRAEDTDRICFYLDFGRHNG